MFKKALMAASAVGIVGLAMPANSEEVSISAGVDYVSEYVFRGFSLEQSAIQPYFEVSKGGLYGGVWVSEGLEDGATGGGETDYYAGYGFDISETVAGDVGVTRYSYEGTAGDTTEFYAGLGFDTVLAPSVYLYHDVDLEVTTLEGSVGHSFALGENLSADLGATVWYIDPDAGSEITNYNLSAGLSAGLFENVSGYAAVNYTGADENTLDFADGNTEDDLFWFGIGLTVN